MSSTSLSDTIVALATPAGVGAIAVIRVSGAQAVALVDQLLPEKDLTQATGYSVHFGTLRHEGQLLDEVLLTVFRAPRSFTGEEVVEISTHGSPYIVQQVLQALLTLGARHAQPGEFTQRAFLNGKLDLAQAEAVADLIASESEAAHQTAIKQLRGGFSNDIKALREQLIHFASLIELELDFAEEDVEFADRDDLKGLVEKIATVLRQLIRSFELGRVIKNGIATVIAGKPNAGKSTLLNALLKEEKAIVSDIAGTTRDFIEDELNLNGLIFRFIDTAGLRQTEDTIEAIGVQRTEAKMAEADLVLYLIDPTDTTLSEAQAALQELTNNNRPLLPIINKTDCLSPAEQESWQGIPNALFISALQQTGLDQLEARLLETVNLDDFKQVNTIVTSARHYEGLIRTLKSLDDVLHGLNSNITGDFLALDIRQALHYLGEITGEITTDDLLANIFSKFCIGK